MTKRELIENEVLKCIENKNTGNPFINLVDVAIYLFLLNPIGNNPSRRIMSKKYRAKRNLAKKVISKLLIQNKIKYDGFKYEI